MFTDSDHSIRTRNAYGELLRWLEGFVSPSSAGTELSDSRSDHARSPIAPGTFRAGRPDERSVEDAQGSERGATCVWSGGARL